MEQFSDYQMEMATEDVLRVMLTRRDFPDREDVTLNVPTREAALDRLMEKGLVRKVSRFSGDVLVFDEAAVAQLIARTL